MPQNGSRLPAGQPAVKATPSPKASASKVRVSFAAIKATITVLLIVGLILVVVQLYYPGVFPWNN